MVHIVDRPTKKIWVTMLEYIIDNPKSSYAQVRPIAWKKEEDSFQQKVYVKDKLEEFIFRLDIMNSVFDKVVIIKLFIIIL